MKSRPILMSGPMVRAVLDGTKTQTRRIIKPPPNLFPEHLPPRCCPYGQPGDLLWVREGWAPRRVDGLPHLPLYRHHYPNDARVPGQYGRPWKPSIHMPRKASRLTLELTDVRVERLQDISEADAKAEGYASDGDDSACLWYSMLWDKINGEGSWAANPWVWALTFKVHRQNVDALLKARAA